MADGATRLWEASEANSHGLLPSQPQVMTCWNPTTARQLTGVHESLIVGSEAAHSRDCGKNALLKILTSKLCDEFMLVTVSVERYWKCTAFLYSFGDLVNLVNRNHPLDVLQSLSMPHLALLSDPWWGLGCVPCGGVGGEGWDHRGTKSGAPQLRRLWLDSYDMWWSISEIDLDSDDQWWCVVSLRLGPLCLSSLPAWRVYQATNAAFMATTKIKRMCDRISELKQQLAATKAELDRYKKMAGLTGLQSWCGM